MEESLGLPPGFMEQLGSGVGANMITVLAVGLLLLVRNCSKRKFKHSACKTLCCSIELDEDSESIKPEHPVINSPRFKVKKAKKHVKDRHENTEGIV